MFYKSTKKIISKHKHSRPGPGFFNL